MKSGESIQINVRGLTVHVVATDDGLVVDIQHGETKEQITSSYAYFNEGIEGDNVHQE